jgi:hypothetical protein
MPPQPPMGQPMSPAMPQPPVGGPAPARVPPPGYPRDFYQQEEKTWNMVPGSLTNPEPAPGGLPKPLPEWNKPAGTMSAGDGQKKAVLMKLISNLLNKPGRSFHEISNGIKQAISTFKNFSKEWDTLHGTAAPTGSGSENSAQKVMRNIQETKANKGPVDGGGGPGMVVPQTANPPASGIPPMAQMPPIPPIAGQPQTSSFNRPAPVSSLGVWGY